MENDDGVIRQQLRQLPDGLPQPVPRLEPLIKQARVRRIRRSIAILVAGLVGLSGIVIPLKLVASIGKNPVTPATVCATGPCPPSLGIISGRGILPSLIGRSSDRAFAFLRNVGLRSLAVYREHGSTPRGTVISQVPVAGSVVRVGDEIRLVLAAGPPGVCGPPANHVRIGTDPHRMQFSPTCLAVPADAPFTITFSNSITPLESGPGPAENISIYKSEADAYVISWNGLFHGSGGTDKALFVGRLIASSSMITYRIGPLPAGTYFFQSDSAAGMMRGTLIVGAPSG
jgi:hypothetical protein